MAKVVSMHATEETSFVHPLFNFRQFGIFFVFVIYLFFASQIEKFFIF